MALCRALSFPACDGVGGATFCLISGALGAVTGGICGCAEAGLSATASGGGADCGGCAGFGIAVPAAGGAEDGAAEGAGWVTVCEPTAGLGDTAVASGAFACVLLLLGR
jgi:hypothetical protein